MTPEEYKEWFDAKIEEILIGGDGYNVGGLSSALHTPELARLPEVLTRQLKRQGVRVHRKGRVL